MSNTTTNFGSVADTKNSEEYNNATSYNYQTIDSYPKYNLSAEQIVRNGKPTNYQLIIKDNEVVSSFTKSYKVIPNELVEELVDEIAENHGLLRASDMDSDWQYHLSMPDTFYGFKNGVQTAMTSVLVNPDAVDINAGTGKEPDFIKFGVGIGNSIDGTQSLKAFAFSFRKLCGNMCHHFQNTATMKIANEEQIRNVGGINTATIASTNFVHRRSLKIEDFSDSVGRVLNYSKEFFNQLKKMQQQRLQKEQAQLIAKLPKTVTDTLSWMTIDKLGNVQLRREPTKYEAWNDLTDILSHNTKIGYNGQLRYFNTVDALLVRTA